MKSIMQKEKRCYITGGIYDLHKHHIFGGACRNLSEKYGLTVYLRSDWHNMSKYGVHFDKEFDLRLKRAAQKAFERDHSRVEFMAIFGKNYIWNDEDETQFKNFWSEEDFKLTEPEELFEM